MPATATVFHEKYGDIEQKLKVIEPSASLVGPFRQLKEPTKLSAIELVMLDREETDLPEMQTFLKFAGGRYAFWRDTPSEKSPVVVFLNSNKFPGVEVIGNQVEHAVAHFCERFGEKPNTILEDVASIKKEMNSFVKNRKNETAGGSKGPGLILKKNSKGRTIYRDDPPGNLTIDNLVRSISSLKVPKEQAKVLKMIDTLVGDTTVCNDEGDFGNGLELGYVLFLANNSVVKDQMMTTLRLAYMLYDRPDFRKILIATCMLRD